MSVLPSILLIRSLPISTEEKKQLIRDIDVACQSRMEADGVRSQNEQMTDALLEAEERLDQARNAIRAMLEVWPAPGYHPGVFDQAHRALHGVR